jgi:hypothetical protein
MAGYRQIQEHVRGRDGFVPKTCWIAHVMSDHGLTTRRAPNRIDPNARKHRCPEEKRPGIEAARLHFGMIQRS